MKKQGNLKECKKKFKREKRKEHKPTNVKIEQQ